MPGFQDKIVIEDESKRKPWPDVEAAINQAIANHGKPIAGPGADRLRQIVLALVGSGL